MKITTIEKLLLEAYIETDTVMLGDCRPSYCCTCKKSAWRGIDIVHEGDCLVGKAFADAKTMRESVDFARRRKAEQLKAKNEKKKRKLFGILGTGSWTMAFRIAQQWKDERGPEAWENV